MSLFPGLTFEFLQNRFPINTPERVDGCTAEKWLLLISIVAVTLNIFQPIRKAKLYVTGEWS